MRNWTAGLLLCVLIATSGCRERATSAAAVAPTRLRIAMRQGETLGAVQRLPHFSVEVATIGDSQRRLEALNDGVVDITNAVADATYAAFYQPVPGRNGPLRNIRGIALMNRAVVHVLVGPHVDVRKGLRGMRIILGDPAGASLSIGERLINAMGVPSSEISGQFVSYEAAAGKLLTGEVDALIATAMPPQDGSTDTRPIARALRGGAHLLEIDDAAVNRLRDDYPLMRRTLLPPGTYPGQSAPLHTVGVDLLLLCRGDLDADIVYNLTKALFEGLPAPLRREMDPYRAPATVIPLHPGAARYYREREMHR